MIAPVDSALHRLAEIGTCLPESSDVRSYLSRHPGLIDALIEVAELVRSMFPASVQLSLELYRDPEIEDEYLTLYIRSNQYTSELRRGIREAAARRIPVVRGLSGRLLVTSDFQPPR